ncbi:PREDICTED: LOC18784477 [Prunus dulcis]|uniref:PREDICTED: LOC18784477 n=1 Tax=Prunus dulcis TaxID=3755 RepID=A0A5E4G0U7_PRUDU|nr:PREDICTED: LOC18784477 [Prunus dulcis]
MRLKRLAKKKLIATQVELSDELVDDDNRNQSSPLLHVELKEHVSFKNFKKIRGCGNQNRCVEWFHRAMHKSIQDQIKEVGFFPFVSILGEGKKMDRPLLVALVNRLLFLEYLVEHRRQWAWEVWACEYLKPFALARPTGTLNTWP